jgi:hypothetical protein
MARNSNGQYDRLVTLRLVTNGDPQYFDYPTLLGLESDEAVEIVNVEDA